MAWCVTDAAGLVIRYEVCRIFGDDMAWEYVIPVTWANVNEEIKNVTLEGCAIHPSPGTDVAAASPVSTYIQILQGRAQLQMGQGRA